jgi:dTDP-4-dehydrorhamnose 3,5-epimerase
MKFEPTPVRGAFIVDLEKREDDRGFFARAWCRDEFARQGLTAELAQCNLAFTRAAATLRGLHYQVPPHEEAKLVRCTAGAIFDVVVDLRRESPSFRQWFGIELTAGNRRMLYVPEGCAHGYLTLLDDTETFYQVSAPYVQAAERGVRWNDPAFGIAWPMIPRVINDKDRAHTDFPA